jgi:hypothetical protein
MANNATHSKRQLYERLHVSSLDLGLARQYAAHLLKKGWHSAPYERRGSIYMQQSAFTTSLVVSYARPFKKCRGWPPFPEEFWQYDQGQNELHAHLIGLRDQVYAHSDSSQYTVKPFRIDAARLTDIEGVPFLRISKAECELIMLMVGGIHQRLSPKLKVLRGELADGNES